MLIRKYQCPGCDASTVYIFFESWQCLSLVVYSYWLLEIIITSLCLLKTWIHFGRKGAVDDVDGARWNWKSNFLPQKMIAPTNELSVCCVPLSSPTLEIHVVLYVCIIYLRRFAFIDLVRCLGLQFTLCWKCREWIDRQQTYNTCRIEWAHVYKHASRSRQIRYFRAIAQLPDLGSVFTGSGCFVRGSVCGSAMSYPSSPRQNSSG